MDSRTVLLVDDERQLLDLLRRVLERRGHRCLDAADGEAAVAVFDAHRDEIDVVVLDVYLPPDGVEPVLDHLQAARPALPILLVSGLDPEPPLRERIAGAPVEFLRKPFLPKALEAALARVCGAAP